MPSLPPQALLEPCFFLHRKAGSFIALWSSCVRDPYLCSVKVSQCCSVFLLNREWLIFQENRKWNCHWRTSSVEIILWLISSYFVFCWLVGFCFFSSYPGIQIASLQFRSSLGAALGVIGIIILANLLAGLALCCALCEHFKYRSQTSLSNSLKGRCPRSSHSIDHHPSMESTLWTVTCHLDFCIQY